MKTQFKHMWLLAVALAAGTGCKVGGGTASSTLPGGGEGASEGGGDTGAGAPSCNTPADHCLEPDDLLVSEPFKSGYVDAQVGKQTAPPNSSGEATYMILSDGSTKTSRVAYRTHRATPAEAVLGALVAAHNATNSEGVYRGPMSRQEATSNNWFVARIVSVDPSAQGHVIVSGGYKVTLDSLRIVEGDTAPQLSAPGAEDAAFVKPEHWVVATEALPDRGYVSARTAFAIQPPSPQTRDEGEFFFTATGERSWSKHAWRTRPATPNDLKLGVHVVAFDATNSEGVYRGPESRMEVITDNWFIGKITDTSESFKGVVTVAGDYRVAASSLRVLVK